MTKEALLDCLDALIGTDDTEFAHVQADSLLLLYINDKDISEMYNLIDEWYA